MKKLLILIFILTTFLFLTSCDKDTPTDESSSETSKTEETTTVEDTTTVDETSTEIVEETTTIEETSKESSVEEPFDRREYYQALNTKDYNCFNMTELVYDTLPCVYTSYQQMITNLGTEVSLDDTATEEIFEKNYVLASLLTVATGAQNVIGYYDFIYDEANNKFIIFADVKDHSGEGFFNQSSHDFCHILVIPKELFPENVDLNTIEIVVNKIIIK
ncbi:MAG: hypothetical protein J6B60_02765 [Clostridia bacterium]|nr:hypothetical protein [Clostridia bacterium]